MKIVISGGAGYIGSVLVPALLADGHEVTVLDNMLYGGNTLAPCARFPTFKFVRADVRDMNAIRPHLKDVDAVLALAALVGAPLCDMNPVDAELVNLRAPLALFGALSEEQLCIMPTTESVYGSSERVCTETTAPAPLSTYGKHKVIVEEALLARKRSISLRLATVFGMSPRMRLDLLVNDFTWRAMKDRAFVVFEGRYRRTCVHVRDVVAAYQWALGGGLEEGQIYNVGSCNMTKIELCEAIKQQVPGFTYVEREVGRDQDQRDYVVSDAKIRATGYTPEWTLAEGIAELLRGYRMLSNSRHGNMP
jgi:nucleoside-diphosphate-sugar epimerase